MPAAGRPERGGRLSPATVSGDSSLTLGEILRLAARRAPRKTAVIAGDRRFDFKEYDRLANRFANLLIAAGVSPGDRIASLLFNSVEYGVVHFGNARAGSVLVHIPPLYAAAEIAGILERTRPRVLVVDSAVHSRLGDDCLAAIPTVIVTGVPALEETLAAPARHRSGPGNPWGNRPGGARRHDVHRRHHRPPEGGGGQSHGALRLGGQHRPRASGHRSGRRRRGDPHVPRRGTDDLVPGLDPGREHRRDLPQVGPRGVHRGNRAPPHLVGVPGAGPGPRSAPLPRFRSGAAGLAAKHRGGVARRRLRV